MRAKLLERRVEQIQHRREGKGAGPEGFLGGAVRFGLGKHDLQVGVMSGPGLEGWVEGCPAK